MKNTTRIVAALGFLLLLSPRGARAAGEVTGRIAGYVYDPTGAALSEVPLTVYGTALQQPMSRTSGDDGRYEFENLPVGEDYVLEVNVPGFTVGRRCPAAGGPSSAVGRKMRCVFGSSAMVRAPFCVVTFSASS